MHVIFSPMWFMGIDSIFEIMSAIIAILVGFYSFKIYRATRRKEFKFLFLAFALLFFAFIARSVTDLAAYNLFLERIPTISRIVSVQYVYFVGIYFYQMLTLFAYLTLAVLSLKVRSRRTISLLILFVVFSSFTTLINYSMFHLVSAVLLSYVVLHFYENCRERSCTNSHLVFVSFLLILCSQVVFIMIFHSLFYVFGHFLQFAGYLVLLINLLLVHRS